MKGMLYKRFIDINEDIRIKLPTIREVIEGDERYYQIAALLVSTPYDLMVQLDDIGVDFTEISEYDLFLNILEGMKDDKDVSLLLDGIDLSKFERMINVDNGDIVFYDEDDDITIDKGIYYLLSKTLRDILGIEKKNKKPANKEAKEYMIERARKKQKSALRKEKKKNTTQLEDLIISLVNTSEFSYDYESILDLTIFQFNQSLTQISKKIHYDNIIAGCYFGTVEVGKIDKEELSWIK